MKTKMGLSALLLMTVSFSVFANPLLDKIVQRREEIKQWALTCKEAPFTGQYSESPDSCNQGDMTLFSGLGCLAATLAGDTETAEARCRDVAEAQDDLGRWWRGPTRVGGDPMEENTFSRDMTNGVYAYAVAQGILNPDQNIRQETKEKLLKWVDWMDEYGKGKRTCIKGDIRCISYKGDWHHIFKNLGLLEKPVLQEYKNSKFFKNKVLSGKNMIYTFALEARMTPAGYQQHLKSNTVLIYRSMYPHKKMPKRIGKIINKVAKILYSKQPENYLFDFFANGVSEELVDKVLKVCPIEQPEQVRGKYWDWIWQRDVLDWEKKLPTGHDCIYLMNLMINNLQEKGDV